MEVGDRRALGAGRHPRRSAAPPGLARDAARRASRQGVHVRLGLRPLAAVVLGLACLAAAGDGAAQHAPDADRLLVLNRGTSEAALVDPTSREVLVRLPVGSDPRAAAVSPDGRWAYVLSAGAAPSAVPFVPAAHPDEDREGARERDARREPVGRSADGADSGGTVTVLDLERGAVAGTIHPGGYGGFGGIRVGSGGRRLWLTAAADSGVVEVDAGTGAVKMLWKTGGADPGALVVGPASRRLYVANAGSDSVTRVDRLTVAVKRIATGRRPEALALFPRRRELWVANRDDHTLTIIDTHAERPVATLEAGGREPVDLAFRPDGRELWVANRGTRTISVFEVACRHLTGTIALEARPAGILFSPDGRRAYVSVPDGDRVLVVDVAAREVVDALEPGEGPDGLAWREAPVRVPAPAGSR